jgi:hypothetical protein
MLKHAGLLGAGVLLGSGFTLAAAGPESGSTRGSARPWYELSIIGEPIMDNQLLWCLSHTGQGMADIGECLDTASRIDVADRSSWPREWLGTAERLRKMAKNSLVKGHKRSAGAAYLRAANYYRAVSFITPSPKTPRWCRQGGRVWPVMTGPSSSSPSPLNRLRSPTKGPRSLASSSPRPSRGGRRPS